MFGVDLTGQVYELILVPQGFQLDEILSVQQYVPAIRPLMILRDQCHADITVMTAFREQVAHLLRIDVAQQIVEDHKEWSAVLRVTKFIGDVLFETDVFPQLSRGWIRRSLAIAPDYAAGKMPLGAQGFEVLQESNAEGRLAGPTGAADNARERALESEISSHVERCSLLLTSRQSKCRHFGRPSFIPKRDGCVVTQALSLEERGPVRLVLWFGNYRHYTASAVPLTPDLVLGVYGHDGPLFQDHVPDDVQID